MTTIVRMQFGSHLYGTNTPDSDFDFKSVYIPPVRDILLQRAEATSRFGPEKAAEGQKNKPGDIDGSSHALHHFLPLLVKGDTHALDMLFAPQAMLLQTSDVWKFIQDNAPRFLSKQTKSFVEYCRSQAAKYGVKGSRVAAVRAASFAFALMAENHGHTVKVEEFLPLMVALKNANPEHIAIVEKETSAGNTEVYFECCNRMVGFKNTVGEAAKIFTKIFENYGERARRAELNQGIDWKAISHAVRVSYEALEIFSTGRIIFPLPNAEHIIKIKTGQRTFQDVAEELDRLAIEVNEAATKSSLPETVDQDFIDNIIAEAYGHAVCTGR